MIISGNNSLILLKLELATCSYTRCTVLYTFATVSYTFNINMIQPVILSYILFYDLNKIYG